MTSVQMRFVSWRWWGRSSPPCGPLTASALGAIDGGAINLNKRVGVFGFIATIDILRF